MDMHQQISTLMCNEMRNKNGKDGLIVDANAAISSSSVKLIFDWFTDILNTRVPFRED